MQHRALFFGAIFLSASAAILFVACKSSDSSTSSSGGTGPVTYTDASKEASFTSGDDATTVGPGASQASSCDVSKDLGECFDYGPDPSGNVATTQCQSAADSIPTDAAVPNESASCSTADRVGSCEATVGGTDTTTRYYSPKWTTDTAQQDCQSVVTGGGTFTPN